jgi:hypothetical protein
MFGRTSRSAVVERGVTTAGSRATDAVSDAAAEFAGRAVTAARGAQRAATPVLRSAAERSAPVLRSAAERSAETLSHAAERAAEVLADTAEKLADSGEERAAQATVVARERLADASESLAKAVRPKKRRRFRKILAAVLVAGGVVALVRSPLRSKLADRLFGAPPDFEDEEPESITLPASPQPSSTAAAPEEATDSTAADSNGSGDPNAIPSSTPSGDSSESAAG